MDGSKVPDDHAVCRFSTQSAEKLHTIEKNVPRFLSSSKGCRRLKNADRVRPVIERYT